MLSCSVVAYTSLGHYSLNISFSSPPAWNIAPARKLAITTLKLKLKFIDIAQYRARYIQTYLQHSTHVPGAQYTQSNQSSTQYDSKNKRQHVHNRCSTTSRAHKQSQELSHQEGSRELQPLTHIATHYSADRPVGRPQRIPHRCTPLRGTGLPAESFVVDFCLVVQLRVL